MNTSLKTFGKKLAMGAALAASVLLATSPAQARDRYYGRGGGNDAAIAIGAGVIGLAVGAAIADRGDRYYYDRGRYDSRRYVTVRGRPDRYYYYAGNPNRYYRDRYYDRYYAPYYRDRYSRGDRWGNGWDRGRNWGNDRRYDRHDRRGDRRWDRRDDRHDRDWRRR
ncbi:hypothetical protein V474_22400 [Novosphingobium barchaimii LL02]|uniref:Uncharacterized protein n=1 Tax=Novosphingobium barchaimii LL02 TaxID=1114963 RepID=A0A0J7XQY1_9SPHN|nr:hypothetical protein [Novosphingobium barchaimii]KMS53468.1 hypothetical protein V474_22400 [Novosphingobium barchaimii LL02]